MTAINSNFRAKVDAINVEEIFGSVKAAIDNAIKFKDAASLLRRYDNKGLMAIACKSKRTTVSEFEQWITRTLLNNSAPAVSAAIKRHLPVIS